MTHKKALEAQKEGNPAAVMNVLERLKVKCPECKGCGNVMWESSHARHPNQCGTCKGKKTIHYTHTPRVGEWCVDSRGLLCMVLDVWNQRRHLRLWNFSEVFVSMSKNFTPILEWEEIRNILKRAGYHVNVTSGMSGGQITIYPTIGTEKLYEKTYYSGDLQTAVMKAVLAWGNEIK